MVIAAPSAADRTPERMEKTSAVNLRMETSEGGLKELVLRWFTETQAPLLLNDGNFPDWFKGFAARKDTEDLLRDKAPGCFLIRLSDKAIGYILSYKGHDRCRHFVITQDQEGEFVVSGDCRTHGSLEELIEHHRVSPFQPFGEYLTSSGLEADTDELYDVVSYNEKRKPRLSVQALRTLWDEKQDPHRKTQRTQRHNDAPTVHPPALPLKYKSRKLTGTVSVDTVSLSQGVPPVPKRGLHLGFSLSGSLPDTTSQTQTDPSGSEGVRGDANPAPMSDRGSFNAAHTSHPETRSTSLPMLNHSSVEEEEEEEEEEEAYSNHFSRPSSTSHSSTPLERTSCLTYSLHDPRGGLGSEQQGAEVSQSNPLYQTSTGSGGGPAQRGDVTYSEVHRRPAGLPDNTYEQIPGEAAAVQGNTYESLEDVKNKKSKSTWGKNWKKFLPDHKKK